MRNLASESPYRIIRLWTAFVQVSPRCNYLLACSLGLSIKALSSLVKGGYIWPLHLEGRWEKILASHCFIWRWAVMAIWVCFRFSREYTSHLLASQGETEHLSQREWTTALYEDVSQTLWFHGAFKSHPPAPGTSHSWGFPSLGILSAGLASPQYVP